MLHVVHVRPEENPHQIQEFTQLAWQDSLSQHLDQVPEIVGAVKRDPRDRVVADQTRRHHQLREPGRLDAALAVPLEIDPLSPQQLDRVVRVGVTRHVEVPEIELPYVQILRSQIRQVSVTVR